MLFKQKLLKFLHEKHQGYWNTDADRVPDASSSLSAHIFGWIVWLIYPTLIHIICVPSYFSASPKGFEKARRATCGYLQDTYEHYVIRRRRVTVTALIFISAVTGVTQADPKWLDVFRELRGVQSVQASAFFDGLDFEVQVWNDRINFKTDNSVDDRNVNVAGPLAVWQRATESGWEIMSWDLASQSEQAITLNDLDDIEPKTDGEVVVWKRKESGEWRLYLVNIENAVLEPTQISSRGTVGDVDLQNGRVVWQEWVNTDWELFLWERDVEVRQITFNTKPDLSPHLLGDTVIWEGVDLDEGDREIFRFQIASGEVDRVTDNAFDDSSVEVIGEEIYWRQNRGDVVAKMRLPKGTINPDILDVTAPPAPPVEVIGGAVESSQVESREGEESPMETTEEDNVKQDEEGEEQVGIEGEVKEETRTTENTGIMEEIGDVP